MSGMSSSDTSLMRRRRRLGKDPEGGRRFAISCQSCSQDFSVFRGGAKREEGTEEDLSLVWFWRNHTRNGV
jgi:hypothetical protein